MIIDYDGQRYPFDMDDVTVKQGLAIEEHMKCSFDEWGKKLMAGNDLRARQALGWLILHGGNPDIQIGDTNFKMVKLGEALNAAYEAENPPEEAQPGPTAATSNGHPPPAASSPVSSPPSSDAISP